MSVPQGGGFNFYQPKNQSFTYNHHSDQDSDFQDNNTNNSHTQNNNHHGKIFSLQYENGQIQNHDMNNSQTFNRNPQRFQEEIKILDHQEYDLNDETNQDRRTGLSKRTLDSPDKSLRKKKKNKQKYKAKKFDQKQIDNQILDHLPDINMNSIGSPNGINNDFIDEEDDNNQIHYSDAKLRQNDLSTIVADRMSNYDHNRAAVNYMNNSDLSYKVPGISTAKKSNKIAPLEGMQFNEYKNENLSSKFESSTIRTKAKEFDQYSVRNSLDGDQRSKSSHYSQPQNNGTREVEEEEYGTKKYQNGPHILEVVHGSATKHFNTNSPLDQSEAISNEKRHHNQQNSQTNIIQNQIENYNEFTQVFQTDKKRAKQLFLYITVAGSIVQSLNLAFNYTLYAAGNFSTVLIYDLFKGFLILRPTLIGIFTLYYTFIIIKKSLLSEEIEYRVRAIDAASNSIKKRPANQFKCFHIIFYIISLPVLLYTGYIRLIRTEKVLMWTQAHYFIEMMSQTIPLILVQIYNHYGDQFYTYQALDILFMFFSSLSIIDALIELFFSRHIIRDGKKKTLMGVILKKKKTIFYITTLTAALGLVVTAGLSIIVVFSFGVRQCGSNQFQSGPFCIDCNNTLPNCDECDDPFVCKNCVFGLYPEGQSGQCLPCSIPLGNTCKDCNSQNSCSQCEVGLFIENGRCQNCGNGCTDCSGTTCSSCIKGYTMINGSCKKCSDLIDYCDECSSASKCTVCQGNQLSVQSDGKCGCKAGLQAYYNTTTQQCSCYSGYFMRNQTCGDCDSTISGCQNCVGPNKLSTGLILDDGQKLQCNNCGYYNYLSTVNQTCLLCEKKFVGCGNCGLDGTACAKCLPTHLKQTVSGKSVCTPCYNVIKGCEKCVSESSCSLCLSDYNMIFGVCWKKLF
ncbi:protein serine threonine [Stylonychia lemnae]|uniref:Protein serine threonine n=1 Tax=Stylonychia lemnae TaxID=5949 RepID=A0A078ADH7_STYLE|nr:protein serine threonine [Stylonychia lemnae]|eukprot:CDW79876.1 protein serine threonine [Stylonychia lemnae]